MSFDYSSQSGPTSGGFKEELQVCRICGGRLKVAFPGMVLGDIPVHYARCLACDSLLLPNPTWLERAYSTVFDPDPDSGAGRRAGFVTSIVRRLVHEGIVSSSTRALDYGCGRGLILRSLLTMGFDAWGFDPYPNPEAPQGKVAQELPSGPYGLVLCVEVIEHTTDPVEVLSRMRDRLLPDGVLFLTTELFDSHVHGPGWGYLAPEHGQHITLFSLEGLRRAADEAGLEIRRALAHRGSLFYFLLQAKGATSPEGAWSALEVWNHRRDRWRKLRMYLELGGRALRHPRLIVRKVRKWIS